jgi:hypothetical protein
MLTYVLYRGVKKPIDDLAPRAQRLSEGNLEMDQPTKLVPETAKMSDALNEAIRNIDQLKSQADALALGELSHPALQRALPGRLGSSLFHSVVRVSDLQQRLAHDATHDSLRSHGVRVALDNFGTGYTTISQLGRVPVDIPKIDQSFLLSNDIVADRATVTGLVVNVAHSMGMVAVAEEQAHYALLSAIGCDMAQGYYIARPMPSEEVPPWLNNWRATTANRTAFAPA